MKLLEGGLYFPASGYMLWIMWRHFQLVVDETYSVLNYFLAKSQWSLVSVTCQKRLKKSEHLFDWCFKLVDLVWGLKWLNFDISNMFKRTWNNEDSVERMRHLPSFCWLYMSCTLKYDSKPCSFAISSQTLIPGRALTFWLMRCTKILQGNWDFWKGFPWSCAYASMAYTLEECHVIALDGCHVPRTADIQQLLGEIPTASFSVEIFFVQGLYFLPSYV